MAGGMTTPAMEAAILDVLRGTHSVREAAAKWDISKSTLARRVRKARADRVSHPSGTEVGHRGTPGTEETSYPETATSQRVTALLSHPELSHKEAAFLEEWTLRPGTKKAMAQAAGVAYSSARKWTQPDHRVAQLHAEIQAELRSAFVNKMVALHVPALQVVEDAMQAERVIPQKDAPPITTPDHPTRLSAAKEVLDRGGVVPRQTKVEQQTTVQGEVTLSLEQIQNRLAQLDAEEDVLEAELIELGEE